MVLKFRTTPSENTLDFSTILAEDTNWHIYRNKKGIFIVHFAKPHVDREIYQISNYSDPSIAEDKHMRIESRKGYFMIPFNVRGKVLYSPNGSNYAPIPNRVLFMQGEHHFRCGESLEFKLSLENVK